MDEEIYILTGPIRSGKTTKLMQWSEGRKNAFGILTPVVDGRRIFVDAHTREPFEMEAEPQEEDLLRIGKFIFSEKAFEKATDILYKAMNENTGWLIIDEIGPMELEGRGFSEILRQIFSTPISLNLLFVVREHLVEKVIDYF